MQCKIEVGEIQGKTIGFMCKCMKAAFCSSECQLEAADKHKPMCIIVRKIKKLPGYNDLFKLPLIIENDIKVLGKNLSKENPGIIGFSIHTKHLKDTKKVDQLYYEVKILPNFLLELTGIIDGFLYCLEKTDAYHYFVPVMKVTKNKKEKEISSFAIGLLPKEIISREKTEKKIE
jgi:hypothetical protein